MNEDKVLKRVYVDMDKNEELSKMATERGMNHTEFINLAIDHFIEYENNNQNKMEDDIYTNRINELTQALQGFKLEFVQTMQAHDQQVSSLMQHLESPTYLLNK